jgi:hypothetical protein
MDLAELTTAWQTLDRRCAEQALEIQSLRRQTRIDALRLRLRLFGASQIIQLVVGIAFCFWGGGWAADHWGQWHLVLWGAATNAWGIALIVGASLQLAHAANIDPAAPVVDSQRALLTLRRTRIACERMLFVGGAFLWAPVLFLICAEFGWDLWVTRPGVVIANAAFAVVLAAFAWWATGYWRAWFERDAMEGSLREAEREHGELAGLDR